MNIPVEVRSALELVYYKLVLPQLAAAAWREWRWSCCGLWMEEGGWAQVGDKHVRRVRRAPGGARGMLLLS